MDFMIGLFKKLFGLIGISDKEASKIHVTCIGIGISKRYGKCEGAELDANNMYNLLRDITDDCKLLVNSNATKAEVTNSFLAGINADLNILYYSGHGGSQSTSDPFEVDKKDEYLCLYNTSVVDNELWSLINQCKGRVLLIFDCCHSETMFRNPMVCLEPKEWVGQPLARDSVKMMCWSGCPDNTFSYGDSKGGILTNAILKAYKFNKTKNYNRVFKILSNYTEVTKYETPKMTVYGDGWNVRVFH